MWRMQLREKHTSCCQKAWEVHFMEHLTFRKNKFFSSFVCDWRNYNFPVYTSVLRCLQCREHVICQLREQLTQPMEFRKYWHPSQDSYILKSLCQVWQGCGLVSWQPGAGASLALLFASPGSTLWKLFSLIAFSNDFWAASIGYLHLQAVICVTKGHFPLGEEQECSLCTMREMKRTHFHWNKRV